MWKYPPPPPRTSERVSDAPQNKSPYWLLACYVVMVLSVLRGIRLPGNWIYSHYLMNYDFGFTKRGFLGSIVEYVGIPYLASYEFFALFASVTLLGNLLLLATLLRDFVRSRNVTLLICSMIFVCSPTLPSLAHFVGHGECIGMFVALVVLKIQCFWKKLTLAVPSLLVALLVHEGNFIFFFPVIFISLLLNMKQKTNSQFSALILVSIFWIGSTYLISSSNLTKDQSSAMFRTLQAETDGPLTESAFMVLHSGLVDNFNNVKRRWSRQPFRYTRLRDALLTALPVIATCLGTTMLFLLRSDTPSYTIPLAISASASPLMLNLLGTDLERWITGTAVTSFLVLYVVSKRYENSLLSHTSPSSFLPLLTVLVFIASITPTHLYHGYRMQPFPFISHQKYIFSLVAKGRRTTDEVSYDQDMAMLADPIIVSDYTVYLKDGHLFYVRDECVNTDAAFLLHVVPSDVDVLSTERKIFNFDNLDFHLADFRQPSKLGCLIIRKLPDYNIVSISTGQYTQEGKELWKESYYFRNDHDSRVSNPEE